VTHLSQRELDVGRLVAQDLTDKLIGDILGISVHTVQEYLDRIGRKIGVGKGRRSRRRIIARWMEQHDPHQRSASSVG
jgi:DNA-binding NarL/FixJ family response regulator